MPPFLNAVRPIVIALTIASLAACHGEQAPVQGQRIALDQVPSQGEQPLPSPNTEGARWTPSADGQAIDFGRPGDRPFLSLQCDIKAEPPRLTIVRHAPSRPGEKALFPVMSNTTIARFKVDAALRDGEWRWEGALPASDPQLDVFTGPLEIEATLPGGGTLTIAGSRIPGEFVNWCRAGGNAAPPEVTETSEATAAPPAR
jgi:hypothetical protein